jgi:hypothetical protein
MRRVLFAWIAGALVLGAPAFAADPLPTELALARRLFSEARMAEESKDWPLAVSRLLDAISIKETPGLRFHLAYCEEQQKLLVEALLDYERAEDLPVGNNEEFRSQIPARRASLLKRIPTLTLLLGRDSLSANLVIDGHGLPATSFGKPIPLNPGKHVYAVSAPGFLPFKTDLLLDENDAVVTNVVMTPIATGAPLSTSSSPPPPAAATPPDSGRIAEGGISARTYVLIGEAAVVAAGLAVGVVFTLEAGSEDETASRERAFLLDPDPGSACKTPPKFPAACAGIKAAVDAAQKDRTLALVGLIGAGAGAAALAGTLLFWPSSQRRGGVTPWVAPTAAGLSLAGRF